MNSVHIGTIFQQIRSIGTRPSSNVGSSFHESARKTLRLLVSSIFLVTAYLEYTPQLKDLAFVVAPLTSPLTDNGQKYILVFRNLGLVTPCPILALVFHEKIGKFTNFVSTKTTQLIQLTWF